MFETYRIEMKTQQEGGFWVEWIFDGERPIYAQLIEQIERAVVSGEYKAGEKLPGVRELAAQAGVNPNTMQKALAELENKGLLYTQRTSGRFVTEDSIRIQELRSELGFQLAKEFIAGMQALGCSQSEINGFVKKAEGEL